MKCKIAFSFIIIFLGLQAQAQITPQWAWGQNFNGTLVGIKYHNDFVYTTGWYSSGPLILGTDTFQNTGLKDGFIAKWDTLGNLIWAQSFNGLGNEYPTAIKINSNHEILVSGNYDTSSMSIGSVVLPLTAAQNGFVAKYDLNGNIINATSYNGFIGDMCIDNANNYYVVLNGSIKKYDTAGVLDWVLPNVEGEIKYSPFDSSIVIVGSFFGTKTIGGFTINTASTNYNDLFITKINLNGTPLWLKNLSYSSRADGYNTLYINHSNGQIYGCYSSTTLGSVLFCYFFNVSPTGVYNSSLEVDQLNKAFGVTMPYNWATVDFNSSISGIDSLISIQLQYSSAKVLAVYNSNTNLIVRAYKFDNLGNVHLIRNMNTIYAGGVNYIGVYDYPSLLTTYTFGKLGNGILIGHPAQTMHACIGSTVHLTGNMVVGNGVVNSTWLPTTGLSSINTDTTSFIANTNISYTLTASDASGQLVLDTFNIIIDTPLLVNTAITSQYPLFCHDSMTLYSNAIPYTVSLYSQQWHWHNPTTNQTQYLGFGVDQTIYSAGTYYFNQNNYCGSFTDSILIQPQVNVVATSTDSVVCIGSSVTLSALAAGITTYNWSNGVVNNIPFMPSATQNYSVTCTDANGCIGNSSILVKVNPSPELQINATPNSICEGGNSIIKLYDSSILYCVPTVQHSGTSYYISNVNFNNNAINNTTYGGPGNYNYYATLNANVIAGASYPFSINGETTSRWMWIDYNQDGDFDGIGELVFFKDSSCYYCAYTGTITIPTTAYNGKTRMRVGSINNGINTPCHNASWGEYEDYNITISGGVDHVVWTPSTFLNTSVGDSVMASNVIATTSYTVTSTNSNGCSASDTVSIVLLPTPQPVIVQNNYQLTCTGVSGVTYQWFLNNNSIGTNDSLLSITQDGTYVVITTDSAGCIGFDTLSIIGLGTHSLSSLNGIQMYPNPTSSNITIEFDLKDASNLNTKLLDLTGQVVYKQNKSYSSAGHYKEVLDLKSMHLASGVYLLQVSSNQGIWNQRVLYNKK